MPFPAASTARATSGLAVLAILLLAAAPAGAANPDCQPEPAVAELLDEIGDGLALVEKSHAEWEAAVARLDEALSERPDDLFLHRRRQDLLRYGPKDLRGERMAALREEYARLRAEHPDDPRYLYLHGRLLTDREAEEEVFGAALAADPDFPWAHLGRMVTELQREESSEEVVEHHLARFAALCPERVTELLAYSGSAGSPAFWGERVPDLRRRLLADPGVRPAAFPALWALEFRLVESADYPAVRERIARDVERLEALEPLTPALYQALVKGYELSGQSEKVAALEARKLAAEPCSREAVQALFEEWAEAHPPPEVERPEEEERAAKREFAEATREWVERCPDDYLLWSSRLHALAALDDTPAAEIVAAGERAAELYGRWRGYMAPTGFEQVVKVFLERGVGLDRLIGLLDRADDEVAARRESQPLEAFPEQHRETVARGYRWTDWTRDVLRARARIARGEIEEGELLLADLQERLDALTPPEGASSREVRAHQGFGSALWEARAELAEATGRTPDAVVFLLRAEALAPADPGPRLPGSTKDRLTARAEALWAAAGGTAEGLTAFREAAAAGGPSAETLAELTPWTRLEAPLPAFELTDTEGRSWTAADLRGKTVFANAWATWCGPCREELPAVQALHERLRERDDVLVITFNMDDNPGAVAPYLESNEFDFPVLPAIDFLRDDLDVFGIPKSWIIDPSGTLRLEQGGYDPSVEDEEWVEETMEQMERIAAAAAGAKGASR